MQASGPFSFTWTPLTQDVGTGSADLILGKGGQQPTPSLGETVTFNLHLDNVWPGDATNVVVSDPVPAGLTYVETVFAGQGSYDPVTGLWTVGSFGEWDVTDMEFKARVDTPDAVY